MYVSVHWIIYVLGQTSGDGEWSMQSKRVGHDWVTEKNRTEYKYNIYMCHSRQAFEPVSPADMFLENQNLSQVSFNHELSVYHFEHIQ